MDKNVELIFNLQDQILEENLDHFFTLCVLHSGGLTKFGVNRLTHPWNHWREFLGYCQLGIFVEDFLEFSCDLVKLPVDLINNDRINLEVGSPELINKTSHIKALRFGWVEQFSKLFSWLFGNLCKLYFQISNRFVVSILEILGKVCESTRDCLGFFNQGKISHISINTLLDVTYLCRYNIMDGIFDLIAEIRLKELSIWNSNIIQ